MARALRTADKDEKPAPNLKPFFACRRAQAKAKLSNRRIPHLPRLLRLNAGSALPRARSRPD